MNYTIELFGKKFNVNVERKSKGNTYVRVRVKDENGNDIFKWISALSAKEAAVSAICAFNAGMNPDSF